MAKLSLILPILLVVALCIGSGRVAADEVLGPESRSSVAEDANAVRTEPPLQAESPTLMPTVIVVGVTAPSLAGKSEINAATMQNLPLGGDSLTEALTGLPGVQYSEDARSALTGGEILPPPVSIAGGRIEENSFLVDGIGIDSRLDPLQISTSHPNFAPGYPQSLLVHSSLLENVTVYDSNISAAYGGFTGGVVDAQLKKASGTFSGELFYRTTRDEWTSFHLQPGSEQDFVSSVDEDIQPRFTKHDGGLLLDLPLTKKSGLLLAYQQTYSDIPLLHFGARKVQTRRSENYLLRLGLTPTPRDRIDLTLLYTPYRAELFSADTKNSDYSVALGGWLAGVDYEKHFSNGRWSVKSAYVDNLNRREAPPHLFRGWSKSSPETDWGTLVGTSYSYEGMYGNLEQKQQSVQVRSEIEFDTIVTGSVDHRLHAGVDLEYLRGVYARERTTYNYYATSTLLPILDPLLQCRPDDLGCRPNDQFMVARLVYPENEAAATVRRAEAFAEDTLEWQRLQLRPGLRASYDDFLQNFNLAPRLSAALDLFGDDSTVVTAGFNRYFGEGLLTYALRTKIYSLPQRQVRATDPIDGDYYDSSGYLINLWNQTFPASRPYAVYDLHTPYKDEWSVGLQQSLFGGLLGVRYIHRRGFDEFAKGYSAVTQDWSLNNNGRSSYDGVLADWERRWERHQVYLNVTYAEAYASATDYNFTIEEDELAKRVWYNGELLRLDELPWGNFNRSWVANLTYVGELPWGLTFSNLAKFRSHYRRLASTGIKAADGNFIYAMRSQPSSLLFDWRLAWCPPVEAVQNATFSVEVYNVFDARTEVGGVTDAYNLGRQFWLGAHYSF